MKKLKVLFGFLFLFFIQSSIFAQVPQKINYQAVARDVSGNPLLSQSVVVDFSIRQSTPSGTVVYSETHSSTTNPFGLFTLEIGGGTPLTGTFAGINWSTGLYYLEVTVNGDVMPASQLLSVPYALHAETATSGSPGPNGHNALADSVAEPPGANCPNGGYLIHMGADDNDDGTLQPLEIDISYYICNGLDGSAGSSNDTSATNELQTLSISNDTIFLTNGGFVVLPPLPGDNDWAVNGSNMSTIPTGNVGIGTATPTKKLAIETTSTSGDGIQINNASTGNPGLEFQTQGNARFVLGVDQSDNNKFKIGTTNLFTNTRFTINALGQVGIGTTNPTHQFTVAALDTVIANFIGANANGAVLSVAGLNPAAPVGALFLNGTDSGIIGLDPVPNRFFLTNNTPNGHLVLNADSSVSTYGTVIVEAAQDIIYNKSVRTYNEADTILDISTSGTIIHLNQGLFLTDSLYVLGNNAANANWVLANDGTGQAVWTNPASLGGASLWQQNGSDIYYNAGNVGIGITSPVSPLTVATIAGMEIQFAGAANADISAPSQFNLFAGGALMLDAANIFLRTASTDRMVVTNTGNVGIGTSTPGQLLHLFGGTLRVDDGSNPYTLPPSDGTANQVMTTDGSGNVSWQTPAPPVSSRIQDLGNNTFIETDFLGTGAEDKIHFSVNGAEKMIIDNNGLVGIGTSTPGAPLHIANGPFGSSGSVALMSNNASATNPSTLSFFRSRGTEAAPVTINQNDEIGIVDFNAYNSVSYGKAAEIRVVADETFGSTAMGSHMSFHLAPLSMGPAVEVMRLSNAGYMGLGTTNPLVKLHVADQTGTIVAVQSSHGGASDQSSNLTLIRSRGTVSAPTATLSGDRLGKVEWVGWNGGTSNFEEKASIRVYADENYVGGSTASHMEFHVTPFGQSTSIEAVHIANNGFVGLGTGAPSSLLHLMGGTMTIDNGANPYTLPPSDGAANEVLTTDGSGNVTWQPAGSTSVWSQGLGGVHPSTITDAVWIGTSNPIPGANLHLAKEGSVNALFMETFGGSDSKMILSQANGTMSAPTKTLTGNTLGVIEFDGHQGGGLGNYTRGADIIVTSESDFSLSSASSLEIRTMNNLSNYDARITIDADGEVGIGTTAPVNTLHVNGGVTITDGTEGAGKILTSDASGNATWQTLPPSINFGANSSVTSIPAGFTTTIVFSNVEYDNGGNYNAATGVFQAPVAGVYHVDATVTFDASALNHEFQIQILRNGGTYKTVTLYNDNTTSTTTAHISGDVYLPVNNTVSIGIYQNSGGNISPVSGSQTARIYFNGHLIR
ncbi:MAG: hypothetical protein KDD41_08920 [Flavobacteriales bacterium]|nr:hypothetical protein [Flavobacteriales bacterium]